MRHGNDPQHSGFADDVLLPLLKVAEDRGTSNLQLILTDALNSNALQRR